jgi:hypothetical protein
MKNFEYFNGNGDLTFDGLFVTLLGLMLTAYVLPRAAEVAAPYVEPYIYR